MWSLLCRKVIAGDGLLGEHPHKTLPRGTDNTYYNKTSATNDGQLETPPHIFQMDCLLHRADGKLYQRSTGIMDDRTVEARRRAQRVADVPAMRRVVSPDAVINGQSLDRVLSAVEARTHRFSVGPSVVTRLPGNERYICLSYRANALDTDGVSAFRLRPASTSNTWLITEMVRLDPRNLLPERSILLLRNPLRNFFIGAEQKQEVELHPTGQIRPAQLSKWQAVLRTKDKAYPLVVVGPDRLFSGQLGIVTLSSDESLASNPDLSNQQGAVLHLTCTVQGETQPWEMEVPVWTYDSHRHHAVHADLVSRDSLGLTRKDTLSMAEIRVRFRVLELSGTYYAAMRFHEGYAGFQYWPDRETKYAWWFSVWNNPDGGWDKHNLFDAVNTQAGFETKLQPPRAHGDQNYANIRRSGTPWEAGRDYTFVLTVAPHTDDQGQLWTRFGLKVLEHEDGQAG